MNSILPLLLLCPLAGPDTGERMPDLLVEIAPPESAFGENKPQLLAVRFTNQTPGPLKVGPFAIECGGKVNRSQSVFAANADGRGGFSGSYTIDNQVRLIVSPVVQQGNDDGEAEIIEEIVEELLIEEPEQTHEFTLAPRASRIIEFDLAQTSETTVALGPGEYRIEMELRFSTRYSEEFPVSLKPKNTWQGRVSSNVVRVRIQANE